MRDFTPYDPRTLEGLRNGFSWCRKCGATWNWKRSFDIPTGPGRGTFPICFDCGQHMTVQEVMVQLKALIDSREPLPDTLPDGQIITKPEPEDLELAERWLWTWKEQGLSNEDPDDVRNRISQRNPKDWSPRTKHIQKLEDER